jgi:predicted branched-subunit amino acid permease
MTEAAIASPRAAMLGGARDALGMPVLGLASTQIGFAAIARDAGWDIWVTAASTAFIWAVPAQVLIVELYTAGTAIAVILLGVAVVNMRFLPMSAALMPHLAAGGVSRGRLLYAANFIAILNWAYSMRRCPALPADQRIPYFLGFGYTILACGVPATVIGYVLAGTLPEAVTLGLVALPPIFFGLVFISGAGRAAEGWALVLGAVAGPLFHLASRDWGLMIAGIAAGSAAFAIDQRRRA